MFVSDKDNLRLGTILQIKSIQRASRIIDIRRDLLHRNTRFPTDFSSPQSAGLPLLIQLTTKQLKSA